MRMYEVPPDTGEKEKVIGGVLNINQFLWLLIGFGVAGGMFALTYGLFGKLAFLVAGPFLLVGVPFAFYKKKGLTLYQLIIKRHRFKRKTKKLINKRGQEDW